LYFLRFEFKSLKEPQLIRTQTSDRMVLVQTLSLPFDSYTLALAAFPDFSPDELKGTGKSRNERETLAWETSFSSDVAPTAIQELVAAVFASTQVVAGLQWSVTLGYYMRSAETYFSYPVAPQPSDLDKPLTVDQLPVVGRILLHLCPEAENYVFTDEAKKMHETLTLQPSSIVVMQKNEFEKTMITVEAAPGRRMGTASQRKFCKRGNNYTRIVVVIDMKPSLSVAEVERQKYIAAKLKEAGAATSKGNGGGSDDVPEGPGGIDEDPNLVGGSDSEEEEVFGRESSTAASSGGKAGEDGPQGSDSEDETDAVSSSTATTADASSTNTSSTNTSSFSTATTSKKPLSGATKVGGRRVIQRPAAKPASGSGASQGEAEMPDMETMMRRISELSGSDADKIAELAKGMGLGGGGAGGMPGMPGMPAGGMPGGGMGARPPSNRSIKNQKKMESARASMARQPKNRQAQIRQELANKLGISEATAGEGLRQLARNPSLVSQASQTSQTSTSAAVGPSTSLNVAM